MIWLKPRKVTVKELETGIAKGEDFVAYRKRVDLNYERSAKN